MSNPLPRLCLLLALWPASTWADEALDALLQQARALSSQDARTDQTRLAEFRAHHAQQTELLAQAQTQLAELKAQQAQLQDAFAANQTQLTQLQTQLQQESGELKEIATVVKEQAQALQADFDKSLLTAFYPQRLQVFAFAQENTFPSVQQLEDFAAILQHDLWASAQVAKFQLAVIDETGKSHSESVLGIGSFLAVNAQGKYLQYQADQGLSYYSVQPKAKIQAQAADFFRTGAGHLTLDPTQGEVLSLLAQQPNWQQRLQQGGLVGYVILALGALGGLLALWKLLVTLTLEIQVKRQCKHLQQANAHNPLGRLLLAGQQAQDREACQLSIEEALLKEAPAIEQGLTFLKLVASVAPLLGLLGTVTGMIATFQSITLFGTGDPQLMAGGISQALITTVLGLCVAIPLLFCHSLLAARCRRMLRLLQQKSMALVLQMPVGH
ncbi:biopolymer transport protein ExbB [Allopseudospirillum japonicum]|uniref:Biopolymer transport protein ExbB n=1 Tax=Allopseudospirillum japonicum TaxID=64971 RepID=A0A1H6TT65_9GAMM|nr:MotA/TolQ/ExbB proton channel family protein [Allopseudospirillum japonicum]SEI83259.1 biopolymer transport protein ExbB [Allopseudospirillum japonicum]